MKQNQLQVQSSDVIVSTEVTSDRVTEQIIEFDDAEVIPPLDMSNFLNNTFDSETDTAADLGDYLSRPVRIVSEPWVEGVTLATNFNPWFLFFNNIYIKKKLDNFSRIRCDLHLKFVINSSPFYYGCVRAAWRPMHFPVGVNTADPENRIPLSQAPGVYLEPSRMSTAEMVLPFLWTGAWLDIGIADQFQGMGQMEFFEFAPLQSANGVSGSGITITVYAWATNVKLSGPTTGLALQSDEYEDKGSGTISGPATAVSHVADMMSKIPYIGPFAKATSIGAKAVSSIAKLFGYSNPPVIDDVHGFHPKAFHAFANVETRMPIDKLCIDPKNEVTIDNSIANIDPEDPLSLANTIGRESFIKSNVWTSADAVSTPLFTGYVLPGQTSFIVSAPQTGNFMTPLAYFGRMFEYWRGSMIYRIKFIKTKYHKGRLLIAWDPNVSLIGVTNVETAVYSRVVDLATDDEIEFEIPYKAYTPYLANGIGDGVSISPTPTLPLNKLTQNGMFTVRVLNVLSGPAANPSIDMLLFSKPGSDFRYARPKDITQTLSPLSVQSLEYSSENIAHQTPTHDDAIDLITTGESIISLRPLIHRSSLSFVQPLGQYKTAAGVYVQSGYQFTTNLLPRIPPMYGYDTDWGFNWAASSVGSTAKRFNYVKNHPLRWIMNCYVGFRGSTNIHINPICPASINYVDSLTAARHYSSTNFAPTLQHVNRFTTTAGVEFESFYARSAITTNGTTFRKASGQNGISVTNTNTQSALSINVPQYSLNRFSLAPHAFTNLTYDSGQYNYDNVMVNASFTTDAAASATRAWPSMEVYYSAGVDFNPVFFVSVPVLFDYPIPNANNDYTPV